MKYLKKALRLLMSLVIGATVLSLAVGLIFGLVALITNFTVVFLTILFCLMSVVVGALVIEQFDL